MGGGGEGWRGFSSVPVVRIGAARDRQAGRGQALKVVEGRSGVVEKRGILGSTDPADLDGLNVGHEALGLCLQAGVGLWGWLSGRGGGSGSGSGWSVLRRRSLKSRMD
jgi:hypothetical protein